MQAKTVVEYIDEDGSVPFREWISNLRDKKAQAIIDARLTRVRMGNLGNCRAVGHGVLELKVDFGPGYRVYFGQDGSRIVVLLLGGNKKSQASDIERAHKYWDSYKGVLR